MSPFRVLPRATNEAPILPCPRPPHLYNNYFLLHLASLLSPRLSLVVTGSPQFTVSTLRDLLTPVILTLLQRPISVTSVLFRRAQNSSHVRIEPSSSSSFTFIFSSLQPTLPFCAISLSPSLLLYLFFVTLCSESLPGTEPSKKKKIPLIPFYSSWPLASNPLLLLLIHAPPPMS